MCLAWHFWLFAWLLCAFFIFDLCITLTCKTQGGDLMAFSKKPQHCPTLFLKNKHKNMPHLPSSPASSHDSAIPNLLCVVDETGADRQGAGQGVASHPAYHHLAGGLACRGLPLKWEDRKRKERQAGQAWEAGRPHWEVFDRQARRFPSHAATRTLYFPFPSRV